MYSFLGCVCAVLLMYVSVYANSIPDIDVDDSSVSLFRGDVAPSNAATYTISRSGAYRFNCAKTASGVPAITITASNVVLDLGGNTITGGTDGIQVTGNNVTIQNGTISSMSKSGILLQGTGCRVENCDLVSCTTGITLQGAQACVLENCRVRNATRVGVSLVGTWTSTVSACQIAGVRGAQSVYGVVAQNGGNNSVEQCMVREIRTSSSTGSDKVVGIALVNEVGSRAYANDIQAIESLTTVSAYGVWVQGGNNAVLSNNKVTLVNTSNGRGQGVLVSQTQSYVASNLCYDCDRSFTGVASQFITSQANARGVYNSDSLLTTADTVSVMKNTQVPLIATNVATLSSNSFLVQSIVDDRFACSYTPITTSTTISYAGAYCLANTINGDVRVTGTGVTLCLNGHTINNGTLAISGDRAKVSDGMLRGRTAGSGVLLTGNKCQLQDLRAVNCRTGFELSNANENTLSNCSAFNCTREGFLLGTSQYNKLSECQAISMSGTNNVSGVKTTSGVGNEFVNCTVNGVAATNGDAYGLWGVTESQSLVNNNNVNDVSATAGMASGITFDQNMWLNNALSFSWSFSSIVTGVRTIDWLAIRQGLAYLATAESSGANRIRIFRLDGSNTLNLCYELSVGSATVARWLLVDGVVYLAFVITNVAGADLFVYRFDQVSETLLSLPNATYTYNAAVGEYPWTCSWLRLDDGRIFLAVGGTASSGANLRIVSFDGNFLSQVMQANTTSGNVRGLDWCISGSRIFLAVASYVTNPALSVYEFDTVANSLVLKQTYNSVSGNGLCARWLNYNGTLYLGASLTAGNIFRILLYDVVANTLTLKVGVAPSGYSEANDWLITGTTLYAAVSVSVSPSVIVYKFDQNANTLSSFYQGNFSDASYGLATRWYAGVTGNALLAVGFADAGAAGKSRDITVLGFDVVGSTTSIVQNNTVSNVSGTGIAVNELSNPTLSNSVYNATTPYYPWAPYRFDPSNQIISG